jgi:hypothetical protein
VAPLSETRIKRVTAPLVTALNQCKALPVNPAEGIGGKTRKTKPLLWTEPRVERWRQTGQRPSPVMVWTAAQCGAFLDSIGTDRLYPVYHLAAYWGLRRGELERLEWADLVRRECGDVDQGCDIGVGTGFGDDGAAVGVADEYDRAGLRVNDQPRRGGVALQ